MKKIISALGLVALVAASSGALAHHSYAMFDFGKTVDVKGTIKEFKFTNPHSYIVLLPLGKTGAASAMTIEANGPGYLVRNGWKRNSLKPGDTVTISMNPLRDGSLGGSLIKATFADGHSLGTR